VKTESKPLMTPFVDLKVQYAALRQRIAERMQAVLDHGQYIMGPEVGELEKRLCDYTAARHCITCASGTEALLIALMALDVKAGDEVITTPFTFVATAEVIVLLGATPVFVDVEPDTCNIDPSRIEAAITPRTRAIMPVALYGQPADMDEINAIAARHRLPVIEDKRLVEDVSFASCAEMDNDHLQRREDGDRVEVVALVTLVPHALHLSE